ncbi:MAG: DUF1223 domain-containing protein [Pseudomonadota bacterium]
MSVSPLRRAVRRLRAAAFAAATLLALGPAPAAAQAEAEGRPVVVVELFTSQGCSACPPADTLLTELAQRPGIVALSLHVDYWDYLGWRDVFAHPMHTKRQIAYRDANGARSIYTPQMVVHGAVGVVGSRRDEVMSAIEAQRAVPQAARLRLARDGDVLALSLGPALPSAEAPALTAAATPSEGAMLWLVTFRSPAAVTIERGENAGRAIAYVNVVEGWMKLGRWDGLSEINLAPPAPAPGNGVAVIVQAGADGSGPILAAAALQP